MLSKGLGSENGEKEGKEVDLDDTGRDYATFPTGKQKFVATSCQETN